MLTTFKLLFTKARLIFRYLTNLGFLKNVAVIDDNATIRKIINNNLSVSRFGDGELVYMHGYTHIWQKTEKTLMEDLQKILSESNNTLLVCIPDFLIDNRITRTGIKLHGWKSPKLALKASIQKNLCYGSAFVFRPLNRKLSTPKTLPHINKLISYMNSRNVIYVGTKKTFRNFIKPKAVIDDIPEINAYSFIRVIFDLIIITAEKYEKPLVLVSCGITATVLCSELSKEGIQAIDIGSFFEQYEELN
jgi:hypothetical protein